VIRRILRRAVRYGFTFLNLKEPFLYRLVDLLSVQFTGVFPELPAQRDFVKRVIQEEESAFLRTLETGIRKFEAWTKKTIDGDFAFELYDTYGFPIDLTQLMARESGKEVDMAGFDRCMAEQKNRSRRATAVSAGDWVVIGDDTDVEFVGYDALECQSEIIKYRVVNKAGKNEYQIVLNRTPFYAESGGQVGDIGVLEGNGETVNILDTQKENNLIVHTADKLPADTGLTFTARVKKDRRKNITKNHSATHLMHAALREVLGTHVAQKGSLVNEQHTRFDFSHFAKVSDEEIRRIESIVNNRVRENIRLQEDRNVPIEEAKKRGAMALFGEKYGDFVRVITFNPAFSVELCGGTHVQSTGEIGYFKITSESAVAAGVRRIEAITAKNAEDFLIKELDSLESSRELLKQKDVVKGIQMLIDENTELKRQLDLMLVEKSRKIKAELLSKVHKSGDINMIVEQVDLPAEQIKNISFELKNQIDNLYCFLGANVDGKPHLSLILSENLVSEKGLNATTIIRNLAKEIKGGGGGQPFYATAGGKDNSNLPLVMDKAKGLIGG
jgi:alanyl-tRNA synthetase